MPRLNLRLLAIVFAAVVGLSAAVYVVHGVQVRRNADFFLREARRAREAGQWQEAVRNYPLYLKFAPEDLDAKEEYGGCLSELRLYRRAFETFEQVLRKDPDRSGARLQLVKVAMQAGRYGDARQHLQRLPEDGETLYLRGRCDEAAGQYDDARKSYEKAIQSAPQRLECYALLATLLRWHLRDPDQADKQMNDLVAKNPNSAEAYLLRGGYWQMAAKPKEEAGQNEDAMKLLGKAAEDADKALSLQEARGAQESDETKRHHAAALLLAAQCALKRGLLTQDQGGEKEKAEREALLKSARGFAQRGVDEIPRYAPFYLILADIDTNARRHDEAIGWLRRGLEAVPEADRADLLWSLTNLLIDARQLEEAAGHLDKLEKELEYQPPLVGYLRGRLQFAQREWAVSARTFEQVRPQLVATWPRLAQQADSLLGTCYGLLGSPDQQLTAFRRGAAMGGRWTPARQGLISALVFVDRIDEALEELRNLQGEKVPTTVLLQYARLSIVRNRRLATPQRNWEAVDGVLKQLEDKKLDLIQVPILRAEALVARGQFNEGQKLLLEARSRHSQDPDLWIALASLAQRQKDWEAAGQFLGEAEKKSPDRVSVRLARARHLVLCFGEKAAPQLRELARQMESRQMAEDEFRQLAFGLAILSFQSNDFELTRTLCRQLADREPQNLQVRLLLFDLAVQSFQIASKNKDEGGMQSGLKEIEASLGKIDQVEKRGSLWNYGWAISKRLDAENAPDADKLKLLDEGLAYLARAGTLRPGWSRVPLMAAEIYDRQAALVGEAGTRQDKLELAIQNYVAATRLGERNVGAIRRVVQLLNQRGRYNEADGVLRGLEEQQTPFSADLARMAAEVYLQLDDLDRALEKARRVAAESKEADDHRWVGVLLSLMSQRANADGQSSLAKELVGEAEKAFRTAIQLAERAPENWIALVQFYGRTNQAPRAEEAIAEALKKIPPGQAALAVARCYEALGALVRPAGGSDYLAESEKKYLAALEAAPNDPSLVRAVIEFYLRIGKHAQAEPLLERVVANEKTVFDSAAVSMARRSLALVLTLRGDPNLDRANRLIEENLRDGPLAPQDRRVYALVLGSYPSRRLRLEAVRIWGELLRDPQTTSVEDQFTLAQLHLALDDWSKYTAGMLSVLAAKGNEPRYLSGYVKALLERGDLSEADQWLVRLEAAAPGQFLPVDLRAQFLLRRRLGQEELAARQAAGKEPVSAVAVEYDTVIATLKAFIKIDPKKPPPPGLPERMPLVASKLDELGRWLKGQGKKNEAARFAREAEDLLRQYVKQAPDRSLVLAQFLGRQGRLDEALDLVEAAWPKETSVKAVTDALVSLMAGGPGTNPQHRRIEALFSAALEKLHRPVPLVLAFAEFLGARKDFERVEAAYREVLKKSPDSFLASNNLAMLLAMQKKKLDEAEQLIDRAIALAGPMPVLLDTRAAVYSAQGKHDQAMAVLKEVAQERPDAVAYFHEAQVHLLKGDRAEAVKALKRAQHLGLKPEQLHPLEREAYERMLEIVPLAST